MEDSRIPKQAYKVMISMDESEQKCWVAEVKKLLSRNRYGDEKIYLSELKQRLLDNFIQDWHATIRDEDRYRYFPYRHVKSTFESEQYFSVLEIYCFRVGLCQLRLGVLPSNNNLHRYNVFARSRNCVLCVNEVEDEEHLLFTCPLNAEFRVKLLSDTSQNATTASAKCPCLEKQDKYASFS